MPVDTLTSGRDAAYDRPSSDMTAGDRQRHIRQAGGIAEAIQRDGRIDRRR